MNKFSNILEALSTAPDTSIDKAVTPRLKALSEKDEVKSDELLDILDDCAYASLASGFAMQAMNVVWKQMVDAEGITVEQALAAAEPRRKLKEAQM